MSITVHPDDYYKCKELSLGAILCTPNIQYQIPFNQRPWSWTSRHLAAFWDDLLRTRRAFYDLDLSSQQWRPKYPQTGEPHFFGAFVFVPTSTSSVFDVMDGQQRLTATTVLAACLREHAAFLAENTVDPEMKSAARGIRVDIEKLIRAEGSPGSQNPRILADPHLAPLYNKYIFGSETTKEREAAFQSLSEDQTSLPMQTRLKNGFDALKREVDEYLSGSTEGQIYSELVSLSETLQTCFIAISSQSSDEHFAFKVFQSLNAKGKHLADADKIKNELFMHTPKSDHDSVKRQWDSIMGAVPDGDIGRFIRYQHIAFRNRCPKSQLYSIVKRDEIESATMGVKSLVDGWVERAQLLQYMHVDKSHSYITDETKQDLEHISKVLGLTLTWPFLMAAADRFLGTDKASLRRCIKLAENFGFRVVTIEGQDPKILENELGGVARMLAAGSGVDEVRDELKKHSADGDFEGAFSRYSTKRPKIQFYILATIEKYLGSSSGLIPAEHSPRQHIEHIMPKKLSEAKKRKMEWNWVRADRDAHARYVDRIGNLCVLEADINSRVGNHEFSAKRDGNYPGGTVGKGYKDSRLHLPAELVSKTITPRWDSFGCIEDRQVRLAEYAVNTWTLDV